jgi:hypothetical protein
MRFAGADVNFFGLFLIKSRYLLWPESLAA